MKELSIEEKAKAYDEALSKAKKIIESYKSRRLDEILFYAQEDLQGLFPELKESEDEKIRKALIDLVKCNERSGYKLLNNIPTSSMIAWLEKQGEQNTTKDYSTLEITDVVRQALQECESFSNIRADVYAARVGATVEKLIKKQGEQKPTNKVEPKFHEGDWVVQENIGTYKIVEVCESWYEVIDNQNNHYSIGFDKEYMCHLWSINDAKDGDILCCDSGWTCIFKALDNHTNTFSSYCFMDRYKWFCNTGSECHTLNEAFVKAYNGHIHPTTKEQRDLLFSKMKEAGYEWNANKKELKKIEDKHTCELDNLYESVTFPFKAKVKSSGAIVTVYGGQLSLDGKEWIAYQSDDEDGYKIYEPNNLELVCEIEQNSVLSEKKGEQKPAWSEKDEKGLGDALWAIQQARTIVKDENDMGSLWYAEYWLKSLKDRIQPKQGWSEEDEEKRKNCIYWLEKARKYFLQDEDLIYENKWLIKCIDWLKSLKDKIYDNS